MQKATKKQIWFWFLSVFFMPPFLWTFITWYAGLFNTDEAIQSLGSPYPPVFVLCFLPCVSIILRRRLKEIENCRVNPSPEQVLNAQRNIARLPFFFIFCIMLYCTIGPNTSMFGYSFIDRTEYILGCLFGVPVIGLYAVPFIIMFTAKLEAWSSHVPMSESTLMFSFRQRQYIVSFVTSVGSLMITLLFVYTLLYEFPDISYQDIVIRLAVIGSINLLLIFIAITTFSIPFSRQVQRATQLCVKISQGDFTQRIPAYHREEIGLMIRSLNEVCEKIGSGIGKVTEVSRHLEQGVNEQAAAIQESSASLEEIASMTKQNAENIRRTDEMMNDTDALMKDAKMSMDGLTESMNHLSVMSSDIRKIIKSINEVAFQTNLLALNAAVEAARAGEAGSGFAVVADEVRNLAMRAGDSANITNDLIEQTVTGVQKGTGLLEKLNTVFSKALENVSGVKDLTAEIAGTGRELARGIDQISASVAETDKVVQQNMVNAESLNESIAVFRV